MSLSQLTGALLFGMLTTAAVASEGRLLATGGASSLEGAAGGGITPWAVLAGYGEQGEWGANVFATRVETGDYRLDVAGVAAAYGNRIELSYARQRLDLGNLARNLSLPENSLSQDIFGLKVRLFGDLIYDQLPQVSLGIQHKRQKDFLIPSLIGAQRDEDPQRDREPAFAAIEMTAGERAGRRTDDANRRHDCDHGVGGRGGPRHFAAQCKPTIQVVILYYFR